MVVVVVVNEHAFGRRVVVVVVGRRLELGAAAAEEKVPGHGGGGRVTRVVVMVHTEAVLEVRGLGRRATEVLVERVEPGRSGRSGGRGSRRRRAARPPQAPALHHRVGARIALTARSRNTTVPREKRPREGASPARDSASVGGAARGSASSRA